MANESPKAQVNRRQSRIRQCQGVGTTRSTSPSVDEKFAMARTPSPARETRALPGIPLRQNGHCDLCDLCGKKLINEKGARFLKYLVEFFRGHFSN